MRQCKVKMNKVSKLLETIIHYLVYDIFKLKLKIETWEKLCQFIKFALVGISNTLISYIIYIILIKFHVHYLAASIAGFFVSVINAYYWNNRYVFQAGKNEKRTWWNVFLKTFASYAGTGLILNNILLVFWVDILQWPAVLGPLINLLITIPLNFVLNKYWAFRDNHR